MMTRLPGQGYCLDGWQAPAANAFEAVASREVVYEPRILVLLHS